MDTKYFILNEIYGDERHICTIGATSDTELSEKAIKALEEHYDCSVIGLLVPTMDEIIYSNSGMRSFTVTWTDESEEEEQEREISIQQSWLY